MEELIRFGQTHTGLTVALCVTALAVAMIVSVAVPRQPKPMSRAAGHDDDRRDGVGATSHRDSDA